MSSTASYREKVQALQNELKRAESSLGPEKCIPMTSIAAAVAPVLFFLALYFITPGFVRRSEGGKEVRDMKKVFMWTVILTLVSWGGMYLFTYYQSASVCARS